mgnify:CR=1 FL=1
MHKKLIQLDLNEATVESIEALAVGSSCHVEEMPGVLLDQLFQEFQENAEFEQPEVNFTREGVSSFSPDRGNR